MIKYYLEQTRKAEKQLAFAKAGYMNEVREVASLLKDCPLEDVEKHTTRLVEANDAIKELESTYEYNLKAYRDEVAKGGNNNG